MAVKWPLTESPYEATLTTNQALIGATWTISVLGALGCAPMPYRTAQAHRRSHRRRRSLDYRHCDRYVCVCRKLDGRRPIVCDCQTQAAKPSLVRANMVVVYCPTIQIRKNFSSRVKSRIEHKWSGLAQTSDLSADMLNRQQRATSGDCPAREKRPV
jgi:hypothetical protein